VLNFDGTYNDFKKIRICTRESKQLHNMYQQINILNLWNNLATLVDNYSFIGENKDWINSLYSKLENDGHSAISFTMCLRQMKHIAKYGIESYISNYRLSDNIIESDV
jgi:hypothetical protein